MANNHNKEEYYNEVKNILNDPKNTLEQKQLSDKIEYAITQKRIIQLEKSPIKGNYDFNHLAEIHKNIFNGLYDWAGQQRTQDIFKGAISPEGQREVGYFLPSKDIHFAFLDFQEDLEKANFLKDLNQEEFTEKFTHFYARINEIHPFSEGNGRATKEMMRQLANDAGYDIKYGKVEATEWNYASKRSLTDQALRYGSDLITIKQDLSHLKNVMDKIIQPLEIEKNYQLSENQKIAIEAYKNVITERYKDNPTKMDECLKALEAKIPGTTAGEFKLPDPPMIKQEASIDVEKKQNSKDFER